MAEPNHVNIVKGVTCDWIANINWVTWFNSEAPFLSTVPDVVTYTKYSFRNPPLRANPNKALQGTKKASSFIKYRSLLFR
jgi:hypothetical protein